MLCKRKIIESNLRYHDIANNDVQDKRSHTLVPFSPGGNLHNYVPFYFCGQTPMLLVNKCRQYDIIFIVAYTETIASAGLPFTFTDRHAVVSYAQFYDNLEYLKYLDWDSIKLRYWADTPDDPGRMEKKQAEFLVYNKLPWDQIYGIAVIDDGVACRVEKMVCAQKHKPVIKVKKEWYYL